MSCGILRLLGCWIILEQMCLGLRSCAGTVTPVPWGGLGIRQPGNKSRNPLTGNAQGVLLTRPTGNDSNSDTTGQLNIRYPVAFWRGEKHHSKSDTHQLQ